MVSALNMILGVGIDIVEVDRIRAAWSTHGERFARRLLRPEELEYCLRHADPAPAIAARFAAKEAASKAFGTGIGAEIGWQDIEVIRAGNGQPTLVFHGPGAEMARRRGVRRVHVSLTHAVAYASAVVVLESSDSSPG